MRIVGNISKLNFKTYYKEKLDQLNNENNYINHTNQTYLYEYCQNPIPSSFDFNIESEWIESSISTITHEKTPGNACKNSNDTFWNDPFENICDSPTAYLNSLNDKFVKIFECTSTSSNGEMTDYKWYHDIDQLSIYAQSASKVKIIVYDNDNQNIHSNN